MTMSRDAACADRGAASAPVPQRSWRLRRRASRGAQIGVSFAPMIDVTFLLLIFFLVTTTFERAEGIFAAKLPKDRGAQAVALPLSPIVVRLSRSGPSHDDVAIAVDRFDPAPSDFNDLVAVLGEIQRLAGFDEDTPVVIVSGDDVPWDHVVSCWNAALRAGCRRVAFGQS